MARNTPFNQRVFEWLVLEEEQETIESQAPAPRPSSPYPSPPTSDSSDSSDSSTLVGDSPPQSARSVRSRAPSPPDFVPPVSVYRSATPQGPPRAYRRCGPSRTTPTAAMLRHQRGLIEGFSEDEQREQPHSDTPEPEAVPGPDAFLEIDTTGAFMSVMLAAVNAALWLYRIFFSL